MKLVLFAYNASHYHTSLSLRALRTAIYDLETPPSVSLLEFSLKDKRDTVLNRLYVENADVYGFSAYIWNITETLQVASSLKKLRPECRIFFGGPEVSYKADEVLEGNPFIDTVMVGEGETGIKKLISLYPDLPKKIYGDPDPFFLLRKPHYFLNNGTPEAVLPGKFIYYESSRGCPFSCGYCLSGSDCKVTAKSAETTLSDLLMLERLPGGKRTVKLVDRTFNYDLPRAKEILRGLLDESYTHCYHFEIQPSIVDGELIDILSHAPEGKFQLEVGIQSTNKSVLKECGRGGNIQKELENLKLLKAIKNVPVHVDLICGLPTETLDSVKNSINGVYYLSDELQIGFLKLLSGTKIADKAEKYGIKYKSEPPYEVLCTNTLSYDGIYLLKGIAHTVDRVASSGKFKLSLEYLLGSANATEKSATMADGDAQSLSFIRPRTTPFDFFSSLSQSLGGNPAAYSQAAIYEKVYLEGLKYISDMTEREIFLNRCREDFRRCERTRMPPILAQGYFHK